MFYELIDFPNINIKIANEYKKIRIKKADLKMQIKKVFS